MWTYLERRSLQIKSKIRSQWTRVSPKQITGIFLRRKFEHSPRDTKVDTQGEHHMIERDRSSYATTSQGMPNIANHQKLGDRTDSPSETTEGTNIASILI